MHGPLGIHVYTCPYPGPCPYMKPRTHMGMGPQSCTCTDSEAQDCGHTCTHPPTHMHIYTGPMDQYAPVYTHIYGCPGVRMHRHHSPGSWALVSPYKHRCAFMNPLGDMSTDSQAQADGNNSSHAYTHAQAQALRGTCLLTPRPSPMCAPGQSHWQMHRHPGYTSTDTTHTSLGQWAPLYLCTYTQPRMCTLGYTHTHTDTNTQACAHGNRALNTKSPA